MSLSLFDVSEDGLSVIRKSTGNVLKQTKTKRGYMKFHTSIARKVKNFLVHRLVATLYIPNPDNLPQVNHKDGNKLNNHKDNLEWCTGKANMKHAKKNSLLKPVCGEKHPGHVLSDDDVSFIRESYVPRCRKFGTRGLSRKYGVNQSVISTIVNNKARRRSND